MSKKAGVSLYLDIELKKMVELIAPIKGTTLSELINNMMEEYIKLNTPSEILDKRISELEAEILILKREREKIPQSITSEDQGTQISYSQATQVSQEHQDNNNHRQSWHDDLDTIQSLTYQVKDQTIDWTVVAETLIFPSAIDARIEVLSYLLELQTITAQDCKEV